MVGEDRERRSKAQIMVAEFERFQLKDFRELGVLVAMDEMLSDTLIVALRGESDIYDTPIVGETMVGSATRFTDGPTDNGGD